MDIVCLEDMIRICAKCAIFGEHKGHEFKSIEQIEEEWDCFREDIVNLYGRKEVRWGLDRIWKRPSITNKMPRVFGVSLSRARRSTRKIWLIGSRNWRRLSRRPRMRLWRNYRNFRVRQKERSRPLWRWIQVLSRSTKIGKTNHLA